MFTIISLKFVWKEKFLCNSLTEGDYWKRENFLLFCKENWRRMYFQISFCYDMFCCHQCQRGRLLDTIGNCVLSLMLHKCHIRYQSFTELRHSASTKDSFYRAHSVIEEKTAFTELTWSSKERWRNQFSPSSLGHRKKNGEVSFHRAHSVIEGKMEKSVFTELTRSSKWSQFHWAHSVITGNSVLTEFTQRLKDFTEFSVLTKLSRLTQELFSEQY